VSAPKLHHYVPRFHLNRFADSNGKIWTLDKHTGKTFQASAAGIAAEKHFYALPEFTGTSVDPLFLEKQFAEIESQACDITSCWLRQLESAPKVQAEIARNCDAPAFSQQKTALEKAPKVEIADINRNIMSSFIALQFFRTADAREILKLFAETAGIYENGVSAEEARSLQAQLLCELADGKGIVADFSRRIEQAIWIFARNESATPFLTSDTPILLKTGDNRMWLKGTGIFQPGIYAVFSITPTIVLYCKERTHWKKLEPFDNCLSPVMFTPEMVDHENSGHAGMSRRFIFSTNNDFEFTKSFFNDDRNFAF